MKTAIKFVILLLLLVVALTALGSQFILVRQATTRQGSYTANAGELIGGALAGQTFVADSDNLSGIAVMFATYSNRQNSQPVELHLRASTSAADDIRVAAVPGLQLNDNQFHRFDFPALPDSAGKTYFFFVVSPRSVPGNAVTVDIDTRDPYHLGSAYIARGPDIPTSGKPTIDLAFETYRTVPLNVAVTHRVLDAGRLFVQTWEERRGLYLLWAKVAAPGAIFMALIWFSQSARWRLNHRTIILVSLFILAMLLRLEYARALPFTDDEGNYLYDAAAALRGQLAGGDGYVKAPIVIAWLAAWQFFLGHTLLAGRLASVVASALTIFPLYGLGRAAWGPRVGLGTAAAWALLGAPTVFGIYVHTQPVAIFFAISGLALIYTALRGVTPRMNFRSVRQRPSVLAWFFWGGVFLGLAVASRKSSLAIGLPTLAIILLESGDWKFRLKHLLAVGLGFLIIIALFLGLAYIGYGRIGVVEALGINSAEDGASAVEASQLDQVRAYSLRGITPFFRESLPLIFLAVLGLGFASQRLIGRLTDAAPLWLRYIISKLGWLVPGLAFWWAWWFFTHYEGEAFMMFGIPWLWYAFAGLLVILGAWYVNMFRPAHWRPLHALAGLLLAPLWLMGLAVFYGGWIKFHANYIAEFLPPFVLLAAYGVWQAFRLMKERPFFDNDYPLIFLGRRLVGLALTIVIAWAMFASGFITFMYEHTGTFQQQAVLEAAAWAKENIPLDKPIFTGAAIVPYVSGHRTALDIAHPRWYAYEFTRKDTARLNTFLPPAEKMLEVYRGSEWFLLDKQTGFSFLMEYTEIEAGLERDFVQVKGIANGSNTLTFYKRIHPASQ